jgi:hypothetical protein
MSGAAQSHQQRVHSTLHDLAVRLTGDGHHMQAIKCWVALLGQQQSMLPADEVAVRLSLARLLLEHTLNVADAKHHLHKAVRVRWLPRCAALSGPTLRHASARVLLCMAGP